MPANPALSHLWQAAPKFMAHTEQTYFWEQNYKDIKTGKKPWKPACKWLPSYCSILQLPSGSWGSNSQSTAWNPSCPGLIGEQPSNLWLGSSRAGLKWSEITWEWGEHACSKSQLLGAVVELVHCVSVAGAPGGTCPFPWQSTATQISHKFGFSFKLGTESSNPMVQGGV